jgi:hypothetical protein
MQTVTMNWWALVVAVITNFVIGGVWYSPALFMKPWLAMSGVSKAEFDRGLPAALAGDLFASTAIAFVLAHAIRYAGAGNMAQGLFVTFWCWLGFVAAVQIASVTYEHRPFKYFAINAGYRFVSMMAMGSILTLWR